VYISGRGCDLHDPARLEAEVQDLDARRFHAEHRESGADLAPVIDGAASGAR
jgi:hypothetical protein